MLFARLSLILPVCLLLVASPAAAQRKPKSESRTLTTNDGVSLHVTVYPSPQASRDTVPVIILHDAKETRQTYSRLAERLSGKPDKTLGIDYKPFTVVTVDLRGHGESVKQAYKGRTRELTAGKLRSADYLAMVTEDMATVRKLLVTENDAARLNLNSTSFIGIGLGAAVALNYTAFDWALKDLPTVKQSKDVKSLVLVSPRWKQNGLSVQKAVRQKGVRESVALLMLYGKEDKRTNADVERIYKQLARDRPEPDPVVDKLPNLMKVGAETELQGDKLLKQAGDKGVAGIIRYLVKHSADPEYEWVKRRKYD